MKDKLVYMASPYSHPDHAVMLARFNAACLAAAWFMRNGWLIFSPIAHTHPIAEIGGIGLGRDWDFWKTYDEKFLEACGGMIVLTLPGWEQSKGVTAEIAIMQAMGKPIEYWRLVGDSCFKYYQHVHQERNL